LSIMTLAGCDSDDDDDPGGDSGAGTSLGGSAGGGDPGGTDEGGVGTGESADPNSGTGAAPATCEGSDEQLPNADDLRGVSLARYTDPTGTSLLLTNNGTLSVVIVPPPDGSTTLATAPYANPTDPASVVALEAVAAAANPNAVPGIPAGVPFDQVYFVPPGWSVCGTTGDTAVAASVRYLRDKVSSATYFTTKALAEPIIQYVTPGALRRSQTLIACARSVTELLSTRPDLDDINLYMGVIKGQTSCRSSYATLLGDSAKADKTESRALTWLERIPKLLEDSKLVFALAHR